MGDSVAMYDRSQDIRALWYALTIRESANDQYPNTKRKYKSVHGERAVWPDPCARYGPMIEFDTRASGDSGVCNLVISLLQKLLGLGMD